MNPSAPAGRALFAAQTWNTIAASMRLSQREFQIVLGIFDDRTEMLIATELGISRHTVNTYLHRLYRKVGVASRAQLIVRVMNEYLRLSGAAVVSGQ